MIEAGADGHGAEGLPQTNADLAGFVGEAAAVEEGRAGFLENDVAAFALEDRSHGVAERLQGLAGETAGAGLVTRKAALVEQKHTAASAGQVVRSSAAGRAGTYDKSVVVGHWG